MYKARTYVQLVPYCITHTYATLPYYTLLYRTIHYCTVLYTTHVLFTIARTYVPKEGEKGKERKKKERRENYFKIIMVKIYIYNKCWYLVTSITLRLAQKSN
jgi:hypothetical protein